MSLLSLLFGLGLFAQEAPVLQSDRDGSIERQRIEEAIRWLLDGDPDLHRFGRRRLLSVGPAAIPALEQEMERRGAERIYQVLRELAVFMPDAENRWVEDGVVTRIEEKLRRRLAVPPKSVDAYIHLKFQLAVELSKRGRHDQALELARALLLLEPRSSYADELQQFRRYCDHRIMQSSLVRAQVLPDRTRCTLGETVQLRVRMENVSPREVRMLFGADPGSETSRGRILMPIEVKVSDPLGAQTTMQASLETTTEAEITIAPGAEWQVTVALDTATLFPESDFLRTVTVAAWTYPSQIHAFGGSIVKKIIFEPAVIQVVPARLAEAAQKPIEGLVTMIDQGTIAEMFCIAMLLNDEEKPMGIDLLIRALEKISTRHGRAAFGNILYQLTGQALGDDPKAWRSWFKEAHAKAVPGKK